MSSEKVVQVRVMENLENEETVEEEILTDNQISDFSFIISEDLTKLTGCACQVSFWYF